MKASFFIIIHSGTTRAGKYNKLFIYYSDKGKILEITKPGQMSKYGFDKQDLYLLSSFEVTKKTYNEYLNITK